MKNRSTALAKHNYNSEQFNDVSDQVEVLLYFDKRQEAKELWFKWINSLLLDKENSNLMTALYYEHERQTEPLWNDFPPLLSPILKFIVTRRRIQDYIMKKNLENMKKNRFRPKTEKPLDEADLAEPVKELFGIKPTIKLPDKTE